MTLKGASILLIIGRKNITAIKTNVAIIILLSILTGASILLTIYLPTLLQITQKGGSILLTILLTILKTIIGIKNTTIKIKMNVAIIIKIVKIGIKRGPKNSI